MLWIESVLRTCAQQRVIHTDQKQERERESVSIKNRIKQEWRDATNNNKRRKKNITHNTTNVTAKQTTSNSMYTHSEREWNSEEKTVLGLKSVCVCVWVCMLALVYIYTMCVVQREKRFLLSCYLFFLFHSHVYHLWKRSAFVVFASHSWQFCI